MNISTLNKKRFVVLALMLFLMTGCAVMEKEHQGELHESCIKIEIETGDRPTVKKMITETFKYLPECYQEKLTEEGWKIVYIKENIEDIYEITDPLLEDITGITDTNKRIIYIEKGNLECTLHELIHACLFNPETQSSFYIKYDDVEKEMEKSGLGEYYIENYDEYIVENISRYLKDRTCLDGCRITKKTVEEMMHDCQWIAESGK